MTTNDRRSFAAGMGGGVLPTLIVTVLAVVTLAVSIAWARLNLDDLGLAKSLPPSYFVGLALLPIASLLELRRGERAIPWLIVLHVVLFIVIVWVTPTILEGTPRFRTSYVNYGYVDPLVRGDGLLPSRFIYHNWPLFPEVMAVLVGIGANPLTLMTWFPLIVMLLYLIPLSVLVLQLGRADPGKPLAARVEPASRGLAADGATDARAGPSSATGRRPPFWAFALWLFPIFDWTGQDYFSPQAFAFFVFLVWLVVLVRVSLERDGRFSLWTLVLTIGLFTVITSTHVLTALLGLGILFTLVLTRLLRQWTVLITCAVIFLVWQVYLAAPFFESYRSQLLETILDLPSFLESNLSNRVRGSDGHAFIAQLRIVATIMAFGLGVIGAALMYRRTAFSRPLRFAIAYVLGVALVAPVTVYGGEMLIRSLLFVLPVVTAVIAVNLADRRFALAVAAIVILMAPIHILTHYGNEAYDYVGPGELAAFDYVEAHGPANIYGGAPTGAFENTARLDTRNSTVPKSGGVSGVVGYLRPEDHSWQHPEWPIYVVVSRGDDAAMKLFQNVVDFRATVDGALASDPRFVPVLKNDDISLYLWTPTSTASAP
jgi:hypothetical protein